jgi:hypothetical protein
MTMRPLLLATLIAAVPFPAAAKDEFTINVPVKLSNFDMNFFDSAEIRCHLNGKSPLSGQTGTFGPMGGKSAALALTGGTYTGPGTVAIVFKTEDFTPAEQKVLGNATDGRCSLNLKGKDGKMYAPNDAMGGAISHKPGTPYTYTVTFKIPQ